MLRLRAAARRRRARTRQRRPGAVANLRPGDAANRPDAANFDVVFTF